MSLVPTIPSGPGATVRRCVTEWKIDRRRSPLVPLPSGPLAPRSPASMSPPPPPRASPRALHDALLRQCSLWVAVCALSNLGAVSAQAAAQIGGAPPKAVQQELCTIADVFGKLQDITTNADCRSGCSQGECPPGWMPTALDECNPQCGRVFEPFCQCDSTMIAPVHTPLHTPPLHLGRPRTLLSLDRGYSHECAQGTSAATC